MTHSLREMAHVFSRAKFVPFPLKRHLAHAGEFGGGNRLADAFGFVAGIESAGDDGVWRPMCSVDVTGGAMICVSTMIAVFPPTGVRFCSCKMHSSLAFGSSGKSVILVASKVS